jgi:hypothetical protein
MEIPASLSERFPFLDALEEDWEPVSRPAFFGWLAFYVVLIGNALLGSHLLQYFDLVFVPIHEGGHLLFRFFGGEWIMVAGGTFLQLFVPFALAVYFAFRRQPQGTAFCAFFFFEQFLPIAIYMADARAGTAAPHGRRFGRRHPRLVLSVFARRFIGTRHANRCRFSHPRVVGNVYHSCLVFLAFLAEGVN